MRHPYFFISSIFPPSPLSQLRQWIKLHIRLLDVTVSYTETAPAETREILWHNNDITYTYNQKTQIHNHKPPSIHYIYIENCVPICVLFTDFQCFTYYIKFDIPVKTLLWENTNTWTFKNFFVNIQNILFLLLEIHSS